MTSADLAERVTAALRVWFNNTPHEMGQKEFASLLACVPPVRDACEICRGAKGGVPGNENVIKGKRVCDYCHGEGLADASGHGDVEACEECGGTGKKP